VVNTVQLDKVLYKLVEDCVTSLSSLIELLLRRSIQVSPRY